MKFKRLFLLMTFTVLIISCKKQEQNLKSKTTATTKSNVNFQGEHPTKKSDSLTLFTVTLYQRNDLMDAFISVSDLYSDSLSIPADIIKNQKKMSFEKLRHFDLDDNYRKKMLKALQLTENDSVYIFNYDLNKLTTIPINKLKSVAYLTPYASEGEDIYEYYYMRGFQLESQKKWEDIGENNDHTIASFGRENPFIENKMVPIHWKIMKSNDYTNKIFSYSKLIKGNIYEFKNNKLTYYLQDYKAEEAITRRQLMVVDHDKNIVFEKTYLNDGEGQEFTALSGLETEDGYNSQWTGSLFKNKAPVIFGFTSESFGCLSIAFMDKMTPEIYINCDNRH